MLCDSANGDGGFAALRGASGDREGWRHREKMSKTAVQQKTADDVMILMFFILNERLFASMCQCGCAVLSAGMASLFEAEDEPEEKDAFNSLHEHARLAELARRNTLCLPHLRSVYPLEVFSTTDTVVTSRPSVVTAQIKDGSRSNLLEGHTKDTSRSSMFEGHTKDGSRPNLLEAHTKDMSRSSVPEGHTKDMSRSNVLEGQNKTGARSKPSSTSNFPEQSELSNQENSTKRKVNMVIIDNITIA